MYLIGAILTAIFGFAILVTFIKKKKIVLSNVSEFLCLLNENKIFPIVGNDVWHLHEIRHGFRHWRRTLLSEYQRAGLGVTASFALINRPFEIVEAVLKNCKAKNQWDANVPKSCKFRIFSYRSEAKNRCDVSSPQRKYSVDTEGYTREVVRLDPKAGNYCAADWMTRWRNWVESRAELLFRAKTFERCWNKSSEKEFWLIEYSVNFQSFVFYLLNSNLTNEDSSCLLTILTSKDSSILWNIPEWLRSLTFRSFTKDCPSLLLAGLNDFLTLDTVGASQTLHLSDEGDSMVSSTDAHSASGALDSGVVRRKSQLGKSGDHVEVSFFQRIRNMLDDKKEESGDFRPRRWSILPGESHAHEVPKKELDSPMNPIDIIKRFSFSAKFFDEKKTESDCSIVNGNSKETTPIVKKKWSIQPDEGAEKSNKKLHRTPSAVSSDYTSDVDSDLLQCLETMVDNAALDIIAEKCKVANLDIKAKSEEQASQSGGWIYCGLEKDTVILKKVSTDDSVPLHSYIGKGMVSYPPKLVYEVLRCPTRRVAYDDMVKNVEILKELEGGMKIVRLLYEVGQHFRREMREFIVLQGERIEGMKHIITLQSVDWNTLSSTLYPAQTPPPDPANPVSMLSSASRRNSLELSKGKPSSPLVGVKEGRKLAKVSKQPQLIEGLVSSKMFSSGWIIEPVLKANKLCSMITYISQMKLDTGMRTALSYLAEDIALKQPLCIVHLRHYLATLDAEEEFLTSNSDVDCKRTGKSVTLSISNALARFRNSPPGDRMEESEHDIVV